MADAATVQLLRLPIGPDGTEVTAAQYVAKPGEVNAVKVQLIRGVRDQGTISISDPGIPIHWRRGDGDAAGVCVPGLGRTECTSPDWVLGPETVDLQLGDRDDRALTRAPGRTDGGTGNDYLSAEDALMTQFGGLGADALIGNGTHHGGAGDDRFQVLTFSEGDPVYHGDDGDDRFVGGPEEYESLDVYPSRISVFGGEGADVGIPQGGYFTFDGGPGPDTLGAADDLTYLHDRVHSVFSYESRTAAVEVSLDGVANDGEPGEGDNVMPGVNGVIGGAGDDTFAGGTRPVNVHTRGGNDIFAGGPAFEYLAGEHGNDYIDGAAGDDWIRGGHGDDTVVGGAGEDFLSTGDFPSGSDVDVAQAADGEEDRVSCTWSSVVTVFADPIDWLSSNCPPPVA